MKGLSEQPEKRKENDPESIYPSHMLHVPIPEGVTLNVGEIRDGEIHKQFGVSHMMHGVVWLSASESVEGTVLYFDGENFRVDIGRRDLTAEEINRIGRLSTDLDALATVLQSLPGQIENAEELIKDLRISENVFKDRLRKSSFDATEAISALGILITKMKPSLVEQKDEWRKTILELAALGVTQIRDQNGGLLAGVPVAKMAGDFAAGAEKAE
jgi:hypothetical protein